MKTENKNLRLSEATHFKLKEISARYNLSISLVLDAMFNFVFEDEPIKSLPPENLISQALSQMHRKFTLTDFACVIEGNYGKNDIGLILLIKCLEGDLKKDGMIYVKEDQDAI